MVPFPSKEMVRAAFRGPGLYFVVSGPTHSRSVAACAVVCINMTEG